MQEFYHSVQPRYRRKTFPPAKPGYRYCFACEEEKALDVFPLHKGKPYCYCQDCARKKDQERKHPYTRERQYKSRKPIALIFTRDGYKICPVCEQELLLEVFPLRKGKHIGACKECTRAKDRERNLLRRNRKTPILPKATKPGYKVCNTCLTEKKYEEFRQDGQKSDGYIGCCKECEKRKWDALPEEEREQERLRDRKRNQTDYRRIAMNEHTMKRKARKLKAKTERVSYKRIQERDGMWCYICKQSILPHQKIAFDHVIPLIPRFGEPQGTHCENNIHLTHRICNTRKKNKPLETLTPFDRRGP